MATTQQPLALTLILFFVLTLCISNNSDASISELDHFYFNTSSSSLSFGNISLFCRHSINVSLINPTNNSIQIDKYHVNDTQFQIYHNDNFELTKHSSINFSIAFTPMYHGKYWSHLSVHTDGGVLYLYLFGVGSENKYQIEPIYAFDSVTNQSQSIAITNPFNTTLIINNLSFDSFHNGLYLQKETMQIAPKQQSRIGFISYHNNHRHVSSSPAPCPKLSTPTHTDSDNGSNEEDEYENDQQIDMYNHGQHNGNEDGIELISNLLIDTNKDALSVPIRFIHNQCLNYSKFIHHKSSSNTPSMAPTKKKKKKKKKKSKMSQMAMRSNYFFPSIDFEILTRPNMSKRIPIKFGNNGPRPVIVTSLEFSSKQHKKSKYLKIQKHFNKSYMVLPDKTVDLGMAVLFAIPNKNKHKKPIKTNLQMDALFDITIMDTPQNTDFEQKINALNSMYARLHSSHSHSYSNEIDSSSMCQMCEIVETEPLDCGCSNPSIITINDENDNVSRHIYINNEDDKFVTMNNLDKALIDNFEHIEMIKNNEKKLKKVKFSSTIYAWISLGNLNYSFQQSLFWVSPYWQKQKKNETKSRMYVPMYREMRMQNNFLIPLELQSLCVFNCDDYMIESGESIYYNYGQIDFEIIDFYKNKVILDGHNESICKLKFFPKSNATFYETQLILNTNITSFQIPMTVYSGRLNVISANMTNDIGNVQINPKSDHHWFDVSDIEHAIINSDEYVTNNESFYFYNDEAQNSTLITNTLHNEYYADSGKYDKKNYINQAEIFNSAPIDVVIDFGRIPIEGKIIHTLELRNENPVNLAINPVTTSSIINVDNQGNVYKDSYDALFENDGLSEEENMKNNNILRYFLFQRQSDRTVKSIRRIDKHCYGYLAIGLTPKYLGYDRKRYAELPEFSKHTLYTFVNVTATLNDDGNQTHDASFSMDISPHFGEKTPRWISTSISSYLLRIKIEFELHFGSFNLQPNPLMFDYSFPGKAARSTTMTMYNYYDFVDVQIDTKQTYLMHNMFTILFAKSNTKIRKKKSQNVRSLITISAGSATNIAKIYFYPNLKHSKYGNYVFINSTETFLVSHFSLLSAPKSLIKKYGAFKALNFGSDCIFDEAMVYYQDENCVDVNTPHRVNFGQKGVNLRELFIEQYRKFVWQTIRNENGDKIQTVAHFFSPTLGKLPFIISADLAMPSFIIDSDKHIDFGNVMVGNSKSFNITIQNLFNETVEISLIVPINQNDAIFFPAQNKKKYKTASTKIKIILQPYSMGKLGPIEFRPKEPKKYFNFIYLRNNITMIESFNVSGIGRQGLLQLNSMDSIFADIEDENERMNEMNDEQMDDVYDEILYPLNVIEDAYLPTSVRANYGFIKEILSDAYPTNDAKRQNEEKDFEKREVIKPKMKDENGGYVYHVVPNRDHTPSPIWQFAKNYVLSGMSSSNDKQGREEKEENIGLNERLDDDLNVIEIVFDANNYGFVKNDNDNFEKYSFIDQRHRNDFMQQINFGEYVLLQKKFRLKNYGNMAITLEGMTFLSKSQNVNDSAFKHQSACIYDFKKTQKQKSKKRKHSSAYNKRRRNQKDYFDYFVLLWSYLSYFGNLLLQYHESMTGEYVEMSKNMKMNETMNYYVEQSGIPYVGYNESAVKYKWNKAGFGVIGCEMFPLQLEPKEYKDFILIFNYDLTQKSVVKSLYTKTSHIEILNNSIKKSNALYFEMTAKFEIDENVFNALSAFKPLESGKKWIKKYSFLLFIGCIILIICKFIFYFFGILLTQKIKYLALDRCFYPFLKYVSIKLIIFLPLIHLFENIALVIISSSWKLAIFCLNQFVAALPNEKQCKKMKRKCQSIWNNDIKRRMIDFFQNIAFEFKLRNNEQMIVKNEQKKIEIVMTEHEIVSAANEQKLKINLAPIKIIKKEQRKKQTKSAQNNNHKNNHKKEENEKIIITKKKMMNVNHANTPPRKRSNSLILPPKEVEKRKKKKAQMNERKHTPPTALIKKTKQRRSPKLNVKKKENKSTKECVSRTVIISKKPKNANINSWASISRVKGQQNVNKKATDIIKPRKPPRPHNVNGAMNELLSQSKSNKKRKKAQNRPRVYSDPVMIEAKTLNSKNALPESPNTVNTDISSHSSSTSMSTVSSLKLSQNAHSLSNGNTHHRKVPIMPKSKKEKEKKEKVVSNTAELVIPLNTLYAENVKTTMTHKKRNRRSNKKRKENKQKKNEDIFINDIISQYAEIKATKKIVKKTNFEQIFAYKEEVSTNEWIKNEKMASDLSTFAAPFVPKNVKHKYNEKGVLKQRKQQQRMKKAKISPTFSSLYDSKNKNDDDLFLLNMAKAINGVNENENENENAVAITQENEVEDDKILNDESLTYHVPDGILSSPTSTKTKAKIESHYDRIFGAYPNNYSSTPSPKRSNSVFSPNGNGFGVDLETLGYNKSPNVLQQMELPKELAPQNGEEVHIARNFESMLHDYDDYGVVPNVVGLSSNDLFGPCSVNPNKRKNNQKNQSSAKRSDYLSLSQLF